MLALVIVEILRLVQLTGGSELWLSRRINTSQGVPASEVGCGGGVLPSD